MIALPHEQISTLKGWFVPEKIGSLVGSHVIRTGNGSCFVDRWPSPRVVLVETAGNYMLLGEPSAIAPAHLRPHIRGFVEASEALIPMLKLAFPDSQVWPRVVFAEEAGRSQVVTMDARVRRLGPSDMEQLEGLSPDLAWVSKTWGGAAGLAASGFGLGAFVDGRLVSVASPFFMGESYEDIGVVTEPGFRGQGLSLACARALCQEIRARGHRPSWTTSADNTASIRVAEKLGFTQQRRFDLFVIGIQMPEPARSARES